MLKFYLSRSLSDLINLFWGFILGINTKTDFLSWPHERLGTPLKNSALDLFSKGRITFKKIGSVVTIISSNLINF
jgi:hypothetical protein